MAWKSWQTRSLLLLRGRSLRQHTVHLSGRFSLLRIQKDTHPSVELLPMQRDLPIPVPLVRCWPSSEKRIRRHPQRGFGISCKGEGYTVYAYCIHALTHSVFPCLAGTVHETLRACPVLVIGTALKLRRKLDRPYWTLSARFWASRESTAVTGARNTI